MKDLGGRPRKELTDENFNQLVAMIRIHCTQDEICGIFGMNSDTLNTRLEERGELGFSDLYKKHSDEGKASLRRMQWKSAEGGNPTMQIWLGKNVLDQSDKVDSRHTSPDGSMQPQQIIIRAATNSDNPAT